MAICWQSLDLPFLLRSPHSLARRVPCADGCLFGKLDVPHATFAAQSSSYTGHPSMGGEQSQETHQKAGNPVLGCEMCHACSAGQVPASAGLLLHTTRVAGAENPSRSSRLQLLPCRDKG